MMRKKGGHGGGALNPAVAEKEEEENMGMAHRKAAALAWFKHGRKGNASPPGSGRGGGSSKMQNPMWRHAPTAPRHQIHGATLSVDGLHDKEEMESFTQYMTMGALLQVQTPYHHLSPPMHHQASPSLHLHQGDLPPPVPEAFHHLPPVVRHASSRFKAEALALRDSSPSSAPYTEITHGSNKQKMITMSTGQSLALLSLLPHHQSQNCFNLPKRDHTGSGGDSADGSMSPWDCGSNLYDSFELLCLSNQLGRCLTTVHAAASPGPSHSHSPSPSSSSYSKLLRNLSASSLHGPSLPHPYIPRSLYCLPQFMMPSYLAPKSSKKRSSLIHPIFSTPSSANNLAPSPSLPAPPPSPSALPAQSRKSLHPSVTDDHASKKKAESSGFRRVFNSLLRTLHMKEDPAHQKPKRSNLSEELEKLPKNRPPTSHGALKYEDPSSAMAFNRLPSSYSCDEKNSRRSPTSSYFPSAVAMGPGRSLNPTAAAAAAMAASKKAPHYHQPFRNEGFRTTSKAPKSVKWLQPGLS